MKTLFKADLSAGSLDSKTLLELITQGNTETFRTDLTIVIDHKYEQAFLQIRAYQIMHVAYYVLNTIPRTLLVSISIYTISAFLLLNELVCIFDQGHRYFFDFKNLFDLASAVSA